MYNETVKIAKNIVAKNQSKKLLQYLIEDKYKNNNPSQNEIQILKTKINEIQKQSFNFPWFTHRFIQQKKHYQDIDPLLKIQQAYKKLNKELRNFQFNDNKSFSDFHNFMESYLNKNVKNQEFKRPSYCKLIHSDDKYNYYYADAEDEKCYQDLHECNTKQDGQQYAQWCVIDGTVSWGQYTTSYFPFYVYVTYKNNIPVMLFNFGYDYNSQIKDIHDDPFTQYDQELLNSIKQLAKKYNFDISKNEDDFKTFNQTDELYNKQFDKSNIDQNIISESQKYNGLNFIQQNIIYDFKKNKKAYLIANDNIVNLQGYKINLYLLNLLKDKGYIDSIDRLTDNDKFISSCSQQVQNFIIQIFIDKEEWYNLQWLIYSDKIKDENKVKEIIQIFIDKKKYDKLHNLIKYDKIKDVNLLKQSIQILIDKKEYQYLCGLIEFIKDENIVKLIIQGLIDNKEYHYLYDLIYYNKIKYENLAKYGIQFFIDNKEYHLLCDLIADDKIKDENQIKQSIQVLIDKEKYSKLYYLITEDKIKAENKIKEIIQILIDKKEYKYLWCLIKNDKIKDENQVKQSIQVFIDNKEYNYLYDLIYYNKINQTLLTQEQKELLKKEKPDIKLSKKLVNIAFILKG